MSCTIRKTYLLIDGKTLEFLLNEEHSFMLLHSSIFNGGWHTARQAGAFTSDRCAT